MEAHALTRVTKRFLPLLPVVLVFVGGTLHAGQKWIPHDDLFSVSFPTEKEGWACGRFGTILHTGDGGATWSPQESGTDFTLSGICFADSKNGWAVGKNGTIVHTSDGGQTWSKQESPVDYFHMDVFFLNPLKGFIVSERTHVLSTHDGGKTWAVQFNDEDYILKSISFCDELHGWAVGEFGYTYCTKDGGENWEHQAGYYEMDNDTGALRGDDFLFDVVAIDPQTAWAVGIQGTVRRTVDGGATWERVDLGLPKTQLYTIASDRAGMITIAGNGLCVFSADGGATWQPADFEPTIEYAWIYDVTPVKPGQFVACGDEGVVYRRLPGSNWQRIAY
jgi:photosystem II stability/assembly factor-like uncharacterized protein